MDEGTLRDRFIYALGGFGELNPGSSVVAWRAGLVIEAHDAGERSLTLGPHPPVTEGDITGA